MILGRDPAQMTPAARLAALAEILALGCEILFKTDEIALAAARVAMAPCVNAVNTTPPPTNQSNDEHPRRNREPAVDGSGHAD